MDDPVLGFEGALYGVLERRFRVAAGRREGLGDGPRPVLREFEKVLEVDDSARVRPAEIDLLGVHAREDDHLAPRAGDRDVEAAMAAFVVERRNLRGDAPGRVGADRAGEDDDLAFVALHVFEVLDEDRLREIRLLPEAVEGRVGSAFLVEKVLDELLLFGVERDDADRVDWTI